MNKRVIAILFTLLFGLATHLYAKDTIVKFNRVPLSVGVLVEDIDKWLTRIARPDLDQTVAADGEVTHQEPAPQPEPFGITAKNVYVRETPHLFQTSDFTVVVEAEAQQGLEQLAARIELPIIVEATAQILQTRDLAAIAQKVADDLTTYSDVMVMEKDGVFADEKIEVGADGNKTLVLELHEDQIVLLDRQQLDPDLPPNNYHEIDPVKNAASQVQRRTKPEAKDSILTDVREKQKARKSAEAVAARPSLSLRPGEATANQSQPAHAEPSTCGRPGLL